MRTRFLFTVAAFFLFYSFQAFAGSSSYYAAPLQSISGKYTYKTYREGKGGFVNELEVTNPSRGKLHVSFQGTYFYMVGRDETFHDGSGEGDGQINGNIGTVTLDDGAGGKCPLTLTFSNNRVTVKSGPTCQLNVDPNGVYTKARASQVKTEVPASANGLEVCPDPSAPCHSKARKFAPYELPFRLPAALRPGKNYQSVPFYAVIVKTYEDEACDADDHTASIEGERLQMQKIYPTRKVFGSYSCPNLDAVDYDFEGKLDPSGERVLLVTYLAVYAGKTAKEANDFLAYVRTLYPRAVLKRMTASYEIMDQ